MNQVIRMDVDNVETGKLAAAESPRPAADWANSLGYGATQGAVRKSGFGRGKGNDSKSKGKDKADWGKSGGGQGAGKGERPVGACSFCWDLGH